MGSLLDHAIEVTVQDLADEVDVPLLWINDVLRALARHPEKALWFARVAANAHEQEGA